MAADFVVENLHTNILENLENCAEDTTKEEAVKAGYLKTDEEFLKQVGWLYFEFSYSWVLVCIESL